MAFQAVCVAGGVIAVFGVLGHQILNYLHVSVPALMIAGGLLLLLIALDLAPRQDRRAEQRRTRRGCTAGHAAAGRAGAIVSAILAVQKADTVATEVSVWCAILAIHVVLWLVMRYELLIIRVIKDGGAALVTRLAGMMLSAIAVQQIINGVTQVIRASERALVGDRGPEACEVIRVRYEAVVSAGRIHSRCPMAAAC
ncbi:hypothetical protein SANTM175S_08323 [Streptomyces antimycoticus]